MTEQLIIEGDIVRHVRTETLQESPLASLAPFLTTRLATTLPVLPQHPVRYISFDPESSRGLMLVETPPKRHVMQVRHASSGSRYAEDAQRRDADGLSRFNVMLPYQYFAYGFQVATRGEALTDFGVRQSFLYWRRDPIRTPSDTLFPARCPNVDGYGSICWGSTNSDSSSLSARIDDLVNNFFTTIFNEDLGHHTPFDTSLTQWETDSENPLAYRDWPMWNSEGIPLSDIAARMGEAPPTNVAELNPTHVDLPVLPTNFTVARAREWLDSLSDGARRRISAAMALNPEATEE